MAQPFRHKKFFLTRSAKLKIEILSKCLLCDASTKYTTKVAQECLNHNLGTPVALSPHIKLCHQNLAFLTNFNFDDLARQKILKNHEN